MMTHNLSTANKRKRPSPSTMLVELRTIQGQPLEVEVAGENPTIADVIACLMLPPHNYCAGTELMFANKMLKHHQHIEEFPDGSIIVAGQKQQHHHHQQPQPSPQGHRPAAAPVAPNHQHTHLHPQVHPRTERHHRGHSPSQQSTSTTQSPSSATPTPIPTPTEPLRTAAGGTSPTTNTAPALSPRAIGAPLTVTLLAPGLQQAEPMSITLPSSLTSTVQDFAIHAIAKDPRLSNAKYLFRGKLLDKPHQELQGYGIHDGARIHAAVGEGFSNPDAIRLLQIREELSVIEERLKAGDVAENLTKQFYEDSMKLLFRLDQLIDLPAELKQQRKDLVHEIQRVQDSLGIKL